MADHLGVFDVTELSTHHKANLEKLATYLEGLPKRYKHFGMASFTDNIADWEARKKYALENGGVAQMGCGTVACAVGHGPAAGVLFTKDDIFFFSNGDARLKWWEYSYRNFCGEGEIWEWMFGGVWADIDNTHRGAAARIRYILSGRKVPEDFDYNWAKRKHRALYKEFRV